MRFDLALQALVALAHVTRQEDQPDPVLARVGERNPVVLTDLVQELVRHLNQHPGAVADTARISNCRPGRCRYGNR